MPCFTSGQESRGRTGFNSDECISHNGDAPSGDGTRFDRVYEMNREEGATYLMGIQNISREDAEVLYDQITGEKK